MTEELSNFLNSDDAIFHYTKRDTAIKYILDTKKLRLNLLKNTNDPYEYKRKAIISCFMEYEENDKNNINKKKEIYKLISQALNIFISGRSISQDEKDKFYKAYSFLVMGFK